MTIVASVHGLVRIAERGLSVVQLSHAQAAELRGMRICSVQPGTRPDEWVVSDVSAVGNIELDGIRLVIEPKVPLRSLIYMASVGGGQIAVNDADFSADEDAALPVALAEALIASLDRATSRGLVKGYRESEQTDLVVRGRWDVARQLRVRPGLPIPVELTVDEFSEDTDENRILHSALRTVLKFEGVPSATVRRGRALLTVFADVGTVPVGVQPAVPCVTRQTVHLQFPLTLARMVLGATSFTHSKGVRRTGTLLVSTARLFEEFVGSGLREVLRPAGLSVDLQDSKNWRFDVGGRILLRPDIVIREGRLPVAVADSKYKVWGVTDGSPPNSDVYQAVAYALATGLSRAHLIYASGEVNPREYHIETAGIRVIAHSISLGGTPADLRATLHGLGAELVNLAASSS